MLVFGFICLIGLTSATQDFQVGSTVNIIENLYPGFITVRYHSNYKPVSVKITAPKNSYILTDREIEKNECPQNATFCSRGRNSEVVKETVRLCADYLYLHLFSDISVGINATVKTSYVDGVPCEGLERDLTNYCYMMNADECINNCLLGCSLLHCLQKVGSRTEERFSVCLPNSTPEEEREGRCHAYDKVSLTSWEPCKAPEESEVLGSGWIVLISLLTPTVAFIAFNIFYYRWELLKKGEPPYEVPRWMPQFLFPRPASYRRDSVSMQELVG